MNLFYKLTPYRPKFNIICKNEQEWNNSQLELFKLGYYWKGDGKSLVYCLYQYPRVLKNHRYDDRFGSKILIMDEYQFMLKRNEKYKLKSKFITASSFIRKLKLKRIK